MEGVMFESEIAPEKLKRLWSEFLMRKYKSEENIPKETRDSDWSQFIKETESEIKQNVIDKLYPEIPDSEKQKLKDKIKVEFELEQE